MKNSMIYVLISMKNSLMCTINNVLLIIKAIEFTVFLNLLIFLCYRLSVICYMLEYLYFSSSMLQRNLQPLNAVAF